MIRECISVHALNEVFAVNRISTTKDDCIDTYGNAGTELGQSIQGVGVENLPLIE